MIRPADACPYPRPFAADFSGCPTFEPQTWVPLDTHFQPLQPQRTCRHLIAGRLDGSFYPRCALGDAAERLRLLSASRTA